MSYQLATLTLLGPSSDGRTNRWRAVCPHCKKPFNPATTRRGSEILNCPRVKCEKPMKLDYNGKLDELDKQ